MKKVSVIIVNYNGKDTLFECLNNLTRNINNIEVIVFDNASPDGAAVMVEKSFPDVVLIKSDTNKGIAYGYNRALKKAAGEYILYLGSDAFPSQDTLDGLISFLNKNDDVALVTPKLVDRQGSVDMDAHRGFPTPWRALSHFVGLGKLFPNTKFFNSYFLGYKDMTTTHEIDACISHFMLVKKEAVESIDGWDESFFVYGEDIDFCYRLKEKGYKIMYLPEFEVLHYKGTTVGVRKNTSTITKASLKTKIDMKKASVNAMEIFYKKHYTSLYPKALTLIVLIGIKLMFWYRIAIFKIRNIYAK
jgi:GT2 family glycosyltransferase